MTHSNGTSEICSINYVIGNMRDLHSVYNRQFFNVELQPARLTDIAIVENKVQLAIERPRNNFDYVKVHCSDQIEHIIFNTSNSTNKIIEIVNCEFLPNMSLMNFILETVKKDFRSAMMTITREGKL